jgi:hypothetical protein
MKLLNMPAVANTAPLKPTTALMKMIVFALLFLYPLTSCGEDKEPEGDGKLP